MEVVFLLPVEHVFCHLLQLEGLLSFVKSSWEGAILTVMHRGSGSLAALWLA